MFLNAHDYTRISSISLMNQSEPDLKFWNLKDHSVVKTVKLEGFEVGRIKVAGDMNYLIFNNRTCTWSLFNSENGKTIFEVDTKSTEDILISKKKNEILAVDDTYAYIHVYNGTTGR